MRSKKPGALYFNTEKNTVGKCSVCADRVTDGLEPSCVQHCIGGALQFVTEAELGEITRGTHVARTGRICYAFSKWKLAAAQGHLG